MTLRQTVVAQFGNPRGFLGSLAGMIMARRPSNVLRNRWTVGLLDIGERDRCLEIGCGPGLALAEAAERASRGHIVGIDRSAVMIGQTRRRNRIAVAEGRAELFVGTLDQLAPMEPFDKAWSVNVIGFVADKPGFLAALGKRLRPGGSVATTYMPRHKGATTADALAAADSIRAATISAGFTDIRVEELRLEPVGAISVIGRRAAAA